MRRCFKDCCNIINSNVRIAQILDDYGVRKAAVGGRYYCPFHEGHSPNLSITRQGKLHCFCCGENWDILKFVKDYEKCDYPTALKIVDNKFHLGLTTPLTKKEWREMQERERMRKQNALRLQRQKEFEKKCILEILRQIRFWEKERDKNCITREEYKLGVWRNSKTFFTALKHLDFLNWLFNLLVGTTHDDCSYDYLYGVDKQDILRKIYKKEISIY